MQENQQEVKNQLASFAEALAQKGKEIMPPPVMRQNNTLESGKLTNLPPMVRTDRHPEDIVSEIMNFADREAIIKFLSTYQKTKPDWDTFRRKIPDQLLTKWAKTLKECRKYGFIAPKIQNEELVWKRVMGRRSNVKNVNECTLCPSSQRAGDCRGREKKLNNQTMFKPCWE